MTLLSRCLVFVFAILIFNPAICQVDVYELKTKREATYLGIGIALAGTGVYLLGEADKSNIEEIDLLNKDDLWSIDRIATDDYSKKAQTASDIILYTAITLPFLTYSFSNCKSSEFEIGVMALETFLINNGINTIVKATAKRYRPFNYNPDVPLDQKLSSGSRLSFYSGHASTTAAFSFFTAQVLTDLHPNWKNKYIVWTTAATVPAAIGYLRMRAGKHFATDVITGYIMGATIGYLVPIFHRKDNNLKASLSLNGMNVSFKF